MKRRNKKTQKHINRVQEKKGSRSDGKKTDELLHSIEDASNNTMEQDLNSKTQKFIIGVYAVLVLMGIGTGYILANSRVGEKASSPKKIESETVVGIADETTFKDSAEGVIEKGGLDGEGTHKLIREGGPSQTAYLMSSVLNLDDFVGKNVKIWGQTMAAEKASWLMDVGKVEILSE